MMYEFDGYDEILKCYEGATDQHASTSFEVGLMNHFIIELFHSVTQRLKLIPYNKYITKGNLNDLNTLRSYNQSHKRRFFKTTKTK